MQPQNPDSRIRTRHEGCLPHGPGQDDRANPAQLLVAQNEQKDYRLRPKLPRMPEEQGGLAPTVRTFLPLGTTVRPLAVHRNGLHFGAATLGRMRPIVGGYRPIHKDGAFPSPLKGKEDGGRPGGHLRPRGLEAPWTTRGHRLGPGLTIHLRNMAGIPAAIQHPPKDVNGVPPPNRQAN